LVEKVSDEQFGLEAKRDYIVIASLTHFLMNEFAAAP